MIPNRQIWEELSDLINRIENDSRYHIRFEMTFNNLMGNGTTTFSIRKVEGGIFRVRFKSLEGNWLSLEHCPALGRVLFLLNVDLFLKSVIEWGPKRDALVEEIFLKYLESIKPRLVFSNEFGDE